jgi:hypothetical protein
MKAVPIISTVAAVAFVLTSYSHHADPQVTVSALASSATATTPIGPVGGSVIMYSTQDQRYLLPPDTKPLKNDGQAAKA